MSDDSTIPGIVTHTTIRSRQGAGVVSAAFLVIGGKLNETLIDLDDDVITCGRSPSNTIVLESREISRCHFKLVKRGGTFLCEDLASTNGTYINSEKITQPVALGKHDLIRVSKVVFKYLPPGDPDRIIYDRRQHEIDTDPLTGCRTKDYFIKSLDLAHDNAHLMDEKLALMIFDLDHFKDLNEHYGHDAGNSVLMTVGDLLRSYDIGKGEVCAHFGGEEFAVLLPKTGLKRALKIAEHLREQIGQHLFIHGDQKMAVTASFGVAHYKKSMTSGTVLLKKADVALYLAKEKGGNQVLSLHSGASDSSIY